MSGGSQNKPARPRFSSSTGPHFPIGQSRHFLKGRQAIRMPGHYRGALEAYSDAILSFGPASGFEVILSARAFLGEFSSHHRAEECFSTSFRDIIKVDRVKDVLLAFETRDTWYLQLVHPNLDISYSTYISLPTHASMDRS